MTGLEPLPGVVLEWGGSHRRDLPWRHTRDPWEVLVAEVMLQRTGADRVSSYWSRFLTRFPTPAACASAPLSEVIVEWTGLGYNRRALNLHRCAVALVERHGGQVPENLEDLLALPGVGAYTARALLVFALERDVGVVDTNVGRVLARWSGESLTPSRAQDLADRSVPNGEGWAWNQALLDLGATICRAGEPDCDRCPLSTDCQWKGSGPDPARGSAQVGGRQSPFEGSDRQGRGRLVDALRQKPVEANLLSEAMGWPREPDRAERVAAGLVADGLAERVGEQYTLPTGGS